MRTITAIALLSLTGCQWARVRYVDARAQQADIIVCERPISKVHESVDYVCRSYADDHRSNGVADVPANFETRVDM